MIPYWDSFLSSSVDRPALYARRAELLQRLDDTRWAPWREALELVKGCRASDCDFTGNVVRLGKASDLDADQSRRLDEALDRFRPWKKGPYDLFGREIDSEWRSDLKWERLLPKVGSLEGEMVADIGCHNGYFMYRMKALGAKCVMGFEPVPVNALNFSLLQSFYPTPELSLELFGVEAMDLFPQTFDSIFCLGILYHHTDPVGLLRKMRLALKPKGRLFIDCQGIPGDDSQALVPAGRYAGASGVWFLPTMSCLENWVRRAGYTKIERIYSAPLESSEQRTSAWADVASLKDFLDPNDASKTKEGYPAPWRHYLLAR